MRTFPLQLNYSTQRQHEAAGVFLPGSSPEQWLRQLVQFDAGSAEITFVIVPVSSSDLHPRGILVRLPAEAILPEECRGQEYGVLGNRLFVPVASQVLPQTSAHEVAALLGPDYAVAVWHPQSGLIGYEASEILSMRDLLRLPPQRSADWTHAQPGTAFNRRLISIAAPWPDSPEKMLENAADGIGSHSKNLSDLKPGVGKSIKDAAAAGGMLLASPFLYAADFLANLAPAKGSRPTWLSQLQEKLQRGLQASIRLNDARAREIERLLKLLQNSPDEGLKYAIPFGGQGTSSAGGSGSRLTKRIPSFDLGRLFGGGAGENWDMPGDLQVQLLKNYRELAEREIRLGRHRRAAYIYAELLNDLNTAAATLVAGLHFREAAVLYQKKLQRPLDAANCLRQGGLLHEAIPIYERLEHFRTAGDLYAQLEDPAAAEAAYRRHVESCVSKHDFLTAADTLQQSLGDSESALALLTENWLRASDKKICLTRAWELLGQVGRHDQAQKWSQELKIEAVPQASQLGFVEGLAAIAATYPDDLVRHSVEDTARTWISRSLTRRDSQAPLMLRVLEQLAPEDRLLPRDASRFLKPLQQTKTTGPRRRAPQGKSSVSKQARKVSAFELPVAHGWFSVTATRRHLIALGLTADSERVYVLLRSWEGSRQDTKSWWDFNLKDSIHPILIGIDESDMSTIVCVRPNPILLTQRELSIESHTFTVGTPGWLPNGVSGLATCSGMTWAFESSSCSLKGFNRQGLPVADRQLLFPPDWIHEETRQIPMHAREDVVFVGLGSMLYQAGARHQLRALQLEHEIDALIGSPLGTLARIAVFYNQGGAVLWPQANGEQIEALPRDLEHPSGIFLKDGRLIVHASGEWRVYQTRQHKLVHMGNIVGIDQRPLAITPGPAADQFAVWSGGGPEEIVIYTVDN
ncbi:hypothetical protein [Planctomicrobium piriforme]|uniref:MoxR-vWA-beta-propeller ternary system domain-containing protein n=1 Tax=Planctomicrobium piriforme TaxID=1576369 RepID=A0A1I3E1V4_9PLAN|nr:hypothetical protein [Planctomicrobium piriforme]SFH92970.1 hypothetical protein SAMN05421753_10445 [Planctomicrobium piriforme]